MLALRKRNQRPMTAAVAGRVGKYDRALTVPVNPVGRRKFNPKAAKAKWDGLEKTVIVFRWSLIMLNCKSSLIFVL